MVYMLGKKPARLGAVKFGFSSFFDASQLPVPPVNFGHEDHNAKWDILANDRLSDCVLAGAAHETVVWAREGGRPVSFNDQCVISDYSAVAGYDPKDPSSDQGTDMADAAAYRRKTGILDASGNRHKVDAYVALRTGDCDQLALATYLMGATGVGLRLPEDAEDQFDRQVPWTVTPGVRIDGGHYVPCVGRNIHGHFLVVTWGRLHAMTPEYYATFCDEALAYLSVEALQNNLSPEGFAADQLRSDLAALAA